jgi:DNA-binding response OmpR family regulator
MKRKTGRRKPARIAFARGPSTFKGETRLLLFINGRHVSAPPTNVKLLAYLHQHLGQAVPMHRLCRLLGFPNMTQADRHILRQYLHWIGRTLAEHGLPYCLTVARNVGYALCQIAPERRT